MYKNIKSEAASPLRVKDPPESPDTNTLQLFEGKYSGVRSQHERTACQKHVLGT